ncbi:MAG: hypothetical protein EZS28_020792 [Streblomastix strix]|uniref:ABC transporter domain-containing protein n=1 Tax=Streblomastix strix TaxID=222440 RepID=A0A5J4VM86_9EUKA|nr:MAG: hypothetical protein EZS28_020792 [Streblomastix strix]
MQLLSFARIIKNASNISFLFLDEATSSLTAEHESEMYQILNELGISYHTVGHGGVQLQSFHNKKLELKGGISGQWELTDL